MESSKSTYHAAKQVYPPSTVTESGVLYGEFPPTFRNFPHQLLIIPGAIGFTIAFPILLIAALAGQTFFSDITYLILLTMMAVGLAALLCGFFVRRTNMRFQRWQDDLDRRPDQRWLRILKIYRSLRGRSFQRPFYNLSNPSLGIRDGRDGVRLLQRVAGSPVRAIVDDGYRDEVQKIEITDYSYEPENIGPDFTSSTRWMILMIIVFGYMAASAWNQGDWVDACLMTIFCIFLLVRIPAIRSWLQESYDLTSTVAIVAPGVLVDQRGTRWTVDDSIMFIHVDFGKNASVRLISPTHQITLTYRKLDHPDFVRLWQCWNHPSPRPELLT